MRFKILGDHRNHFSKEQQIEFDDVFTLADLDAVAAHIDQVLEKRCQKLIETENPEHLYRLGRDLWRDDETIRSFVCNKRLAEIASQLFSQNWLWLGFDQVLRSTTQTTSHFLPPSSLQQISCIQPLCGYAIVRLTESNTSAPLIPKKRENIVFVGPDLTIPWEMFFQQPHQSFLLIAFAPAKALYVLQKNDCHTHDLKKRGYVFGDRLKEPEHRIILK